MRSTAGAEVQRRGVYNVIHYGAHREPHKAILREGESFPNCRRCGTAVLFEFFKALSERDEVDHIGYDPDFMDSVLRAFSKAG